MRRQLSRQARIWGDTYRRLAPVLLDLGINPDAAFARLELLGSPSASKSDITSGNTPDPDACPCDGCGARRPRQRP